MRSVRNIQEAKMVEDIGGNMPRIYASLDNNQEEYQSPMIEVEGNIDNQPILVLIDSRASHSVMPHLNLSSLMTLWLNCISFDYYL
jgi:hypothetical protein